MEKSSPSVKIACLPLKQGNYSLVTFVMSAKQLWELVDVNRREEDKREGYQRVLAPERTAQVARFIDSGNAVPTCIVISFDAGKAKLSSDKKHLSIDSGGDAGWVIDGQHRLCGASEAATEIEVSVVAFLDISLEDQINQFVIINREAKKVPTSLYLDLLPDIKSPKGDTDSAKEIAVNLANAMREEETSPFYNRIVSLKSPAKGQISLTNFVRKVAPKVHRSTGILRGRAQRYQRAMLENYFNALADVYPKEFTGQDCIFFKTIGFGAIMEAFDKVHDITLARTSDSFTRKDVVETLLHVPDFNFQDWRKMGTGSGAEKYAAEPFIAELSRTADIAEEDKGRLKV